ncbi:MAG: GH3 auxin-responsive promoter family protein [Candidatus Omnitrophica bacterium]|nr:GH3 auxin-responsive promoter family protein [Candidatus Omnitrophota bacterium]
MNFKRLMIKALFFKARAFEEATRDPIAAQKRVLFDCVARGKGTEYGRACGFSGIKSISDFQASVPLADYERLRTYIDRMKKGEANILTADPVILFGSTSGTTAQPKLIPITKYSRAVKAGVMDIWAYYVARDHPRVVDGRVLAVVSPEIEGYTESGIPYGAESGHGYKNMPWAVKGLYALPYQVFDIADYESRYYCILRIGMECGDVTTVVTLNPSTFIILCQKAEFWKGRIIEDIENGTLFAGLDISSDIRKALERILRPNPGRAEELKAIVSERKELLPKYFWPRLEVIECWKASAAKLYLKELPRYFGAVPVRDLGCLSTEARSSIPMGDKGAGGVLAINANFYEFIPKEDIDKEKKRILLCDQLEAGKEYFLVVTTPGGLYRYNIDDIIRVDGFFNKTPVIEFVQKGLNAVSLAGEKLYEAHVSRAVNRALARHRLSIGFFSASVEWGSPPRYLFLMEFSDHPSPEQKRALLRSIEEELYGQNSEYKEKRRAQLLGAPVLKVVARGDFERYRARKIGEGSPDSQFKVPELVADFEFQDKFHIEEEIGMD